MGDFSNGGDDDHTAEKGRGRGREERGERELFSLKVNNELSSGVLQRTCDIGGSSQELGEGDAIPGGSGSEVSVSPSSSAAASSAAAGAISPSLLPCLPKLSSATSYSVS